MQASTFSPRRRRSPSRPSAVAPGEPPLAVVEPPCVDGPPSSRRRSRVRPEGGHARTVAPATSRIGEPPAPLPESSRAGPTHRYAGGQGRLALPWPGARATALPWAGLPCHGRGPVPPRSTAPCHGCLAAVPGPLRRRHEREREREGGFEREEEGRERMDVWTAPSRSARESNDPEISDDVDKSGAREDGERFV